MEDDCACPMCRLFDDILEHSLGYDDLDDDGDEETNMDGYCPVHMRFFGFTSSECPECARERAVPPPPPASSRRIEALKAMARQNASPNERDIARDKLAQMGISY